MGSPLAGAGGEFESVEQLRRSHSSRVESVAAYRPLYVEPSTIATVVKSMIPGLLVAVSEVKTDARPAVFVRGDPEAVKQFQQLADYVDTPADLVEVRAILVEVSTAGRDGWSVSAVARAIGGKLGVAVGSGISGAGGDKATFSSANFDAVLGAVNTMNAARVLSMPSLSGRSGESLRIQVGDDVPVLGAIITPGLGVTSNEVQYRSSGSIFEVLPVVHGESVTVSMSQELSNFVETDTGVRGSPTLSKRSVKSTLDLANGEWVVIGGLGAHSVARARESLLGLVPTGRSKTTRATDVVMLLSVRVISREGRRAPARKVPAVMLDGGARNSPPRQQ